MLCSNCGKDIPFNGNVCPWCHADKSGDQFVYGLSFVAGLVGFFVGNLVNGCVGGFVGMLVCMVPAMIASSVFVQKVKTRRQAEAHEKSRHQESLQRQAHETIVRLGNPNSTPPGTIGLIEEENDGEGEFEIVGVDKGSGYDTTWHVHAMTPANARVKAELEGIIVTSVKRVTKSKSRRAAR